MKKRIISILLATALLLSLAACGSQDAASSTSESENAAVSNPYTGTVSAISTKSITLSTDTGDVEIALSDSTTYSRESRGGMGDAPEAPEEEPTADASQGTTPPELPDGESGQAGGGMESMGTRDATISDLSLGDTVTVTTDEDGIATTVVLSAGNSGGEGSDRKQDGAGSASSGVDSYDAVTEFTSDAGESGKTYTSTGTDENAIHIYEDAAATIEDSTITRTSSDSTGGDNSSFYGIGAAALVTEGSLTISDSTVETDAAGGAGVFAYGDGTAYLIDTIINTVQDTSGGIHVAGGGTLYAWDLTVESNGESSAAIRSDRGSGTMVVDGGTYTSNGLGSPAIYSAADITVNDATLSATGSEAICIEGLNSIRLFDCNLSGDMEDLS